MKNNLKEMRILFISIFLFPYCILSQFPGDKEVLNSVQLYYNYQTADAVYQLDELREKYPENPTVHLAWAAGIWLHSQANDDIETSYNTLNTALEQVIPVYETLIKKYPDIPHYKLYLGSSLGLRARVNLGKKEWVKTLINAYKGFNLTYKVAQEYPSITDAFLPIGIVEYYAGLSPPVIKWTVKLFGLEAERKTGLKKITKAADEGKFARIEAASDAAFLFLWVENEPNMALPYAKYLAQKFPDNYYFNILFLESLIKTKQYGEAAELILVLKNTLNNLTPIQISWYRSYLLYEEALLEMYHNHNQKALSLVDIAINGYGAELDVMLANMYYLKGKLLLISGDIESALISFEECTKLDNYSWAAEESHRQEEKLNKTANP